MQTRPLWRALGGNARYHFDTSIKTRQNDNQTWATLLTLIGYSAGVLMMLCFPNRQALFTVVLAFCFTPVVIDAGETPPPAIAQRLPGYALVGFVDLNMDGQSDRRLLHKVLKSAHCRIDNEVDDQGIRRPEGSKITPRTKMLVVAEIPDPANLKDPKAQMVATRIHRHYQDMRTEAKDAEVRVVRLNDLFRFGGPPRRVKDSGPTSKIYSRGKQLRQPGIGQTNGVYSRTKSQ